MAAPSSPSAIPALDELIARVAELVNETGPGADGARVVSLQLTGGDAFELGIWDPPPMPHPLDSLVGFRAPEGWTAVGFVATGRRWTLEGAEPPVPVTSTVLLARTGAAASVLDDGSGDPQLLLDPPVGPAADVLARVLGLPTPTPDQSTAALAELTWLDRIASGLAHRPARGRSWRWLADRHPLRGGGETPSPEILAVRTERHARRHPWSALRTRAGSVVLPPPAECSPPGTVLDPAEWFDDGTLCRWTLRRLPHPDALASVIVDHLPTHAVEDLQAALIEVDLAGTDRWC